MNGRKNGVATNFVDSFGLVHLGPLPSDTPENAILYTVTNWLLTKKFPVNAHQMLLSHYDPGTGNLYTFPEELREKLDNHTIASHDNMTAIITAMVILGLSVDGIRSWPNYLHPRDIIYIGYLQNRLWAHFLLPVLFFVFVWTGLTKYKYRNNKKIFKTDSEILYWIRLQLPKRFRFIHVTKFIITKLFRFKFGDDWVRSMMRIYYKNPDHPNRMGTRA